MVKLGGLQNGRVDIDTASLLPRRDDDCRVQRCSGKSNFKTFAGIPHRQKRERDQYDIFSCYLIIFETRMALVVIFVVLSLMRRDRTTGCDMPDLG